MLQRVVVGVDAVAARSRTVVCATGGGGIVKRPPPLWITSRHLQRDSAAPECSRVWSEFLGQHLQRKLLGPHLEPLGHVHHRTRRKERGDLRATVRTAEPQHRRWGHVPAPATAAAGLSMMRTPSRRRVRQKVMVLAVAGDGHGPRLRASRPTGPTASAGPKEPRPRSPTFTPASGGERPAEFGDGRYRMKAGGSG